MRSNLLRITAVLIVLALALPLGAKPVSKKFNLVGPAKIGRTELDAGRYHVLVDGSKVTVMQGKEIVAEVEGKLEERETKQRHTSVMTGPDGQVQEIRFAGDNRVLVLEY